jgi:hypothetical protein
VGAEHRETSSRRARRQVAPIFWFARILREDLESKTYVADTSGIFHVYNCISTESLTRVGPRNYPRRSQGGARCPPSKGPVLFGGAKTVCPTTVDGNTEDPTSGNTEDPATVCALAVPNGTTVCALTIPAGSP